MARYEPAAAALEAAEGFRDRCLLNDGSVFTQKSLWNSANLAHLRHYFIERLTRATVIS
jgi:hypothetical protein